SPGFPQVGHSGADAYFSQIKLFCNSMVVQQSCPIQGSMFASPARKNHSDKSSKAARILTS
ncbi:hypothetical protein ACE04B_38115, partial [Rhizobium phaseoli]